MIGSSALRWNTDTHWGCVTLHMPSHGPSSSIRRSTVDPSDAPRPIGDVLTEAIFVNLFLLSVFAIYAFFWLDRWVLRKTLLAQLNERMKRFDIWAIHVTRISAAIFFLTLGAWHWIFGSSFFLTPELRTGFVTQPER